MVTAWACGARGESTTKCPLRGACEPTALGRHGTVLPHPTPPVQGVEVGAPYGYMVGLDSGCQGARQNELQGQRVALIHG
jgi:hypothetical protein